MLRPARKGVTTAGLRLLPIVAVLAMLALAPFARTAAAAGTFVVNTTEDPGQGSCTANPGGCTLRAAINAANAAGGGTIQFDIPGAAVAPTISVGSPLPPIKTAVTIDGATQPNTAAGSPGVTILPTWQNGPGTIIDLAPGSDASTVHGLAFGGIVGSAASTAISVESTHDFVTGNWIGIAADSSTLGQGSIGIDVTGSDNRIGGGAAGDPNVVASALSAIVIGTPDGITMPFGNAVQGNVIGLDQDGTPAGGGIVGIAVADTQRTIVGNGDGPDGLADVQAHPELGNVIAGYGTAIRIADGSTGTIAAGNFVGVDRSRAPTAPNVDGFVVQGPSSFVAASTNGNQIGPGNVLAHSHADGVLIDGSLGNANGNRIVANSIFDNNTDGAGSLGIDLVQGKGTGTTANDAIAAPVITSVSPGGTVSGTYSTPNNGSAFIELFINPSCTGAYASGAGDVFSEFVTGTNGTFTANVGGLKPSDGITATATDAVTADTSEFSNCATQGDLSGSVDQSVVKPVDLTAAGTQDWALWGYNSPATDLPASALTPNETKANGGRQISDLTIVNGDGTATRGFGSFPDNLVPFNFDWSDGSPDAAVSGGHGGITNPALGQALSFTVPAGTTPRRLTIWTSAHYADGSLTAHLSDGSAPDFTKTIQAFAGAPFPSENAPAIFTLDYQAASDGQHLTVTWKQTANNNCGGACEDIVIYAAALSASSGVATGAKATLKSGQSVEMPATVPIADIPLAAFDAQPPGAPPITTHGTQLNQTQLNQTQLNQTQLNQTQLNQTQLNQTQLNQTQLNQTPLAAQLNQTQLNQTQLNQTQLNQTQLNQTQLNQTQLNQTQLNQTPLDPSRFPGGWADLLRYTTLAGAPLQTLTLGEVMSLTTADVVLSSLPTGTTAQSVIDRIQHLTFADLEIQSSSLAQLTVGALILGNLDVNQLGSGLEDPIESQLQDWCLSFAPAGDPTNFCTGNSTGSDTVPNGGPGMGYLSLIQLSLLGAPVQSLQLNQTQLNQTQLNQTQLNQTQLNQTPVGDLASSASGIVGMQVSRLDLTTGIGIGGVKVNLLPASVLSTRLDCSNPANFDCATGTLAQAQAAGAIPSTTTVGDLDAGTFFHGVTIGQLLQSVRGPLSAYKDIVTFGDLVGLLLQASDVKWETLPPDLLAIFDPNRPHLSMTAGFTIAGSGVFPGDVKIDLPPGFDFAPGSATLSENGGAAIPLADPTITGTTAGGYTLHWHLDAVDAGAPYAIVFGALAGTTVGPTQATETVTAQGHSDSSIAAFSVTDSFPGSDSAPDATPVDTSPGGESVEMSTLPVSGAVDYFTIPMPAAGTRIQVHLTNLPTDYDLALYSPRSTSVRTGATSAPPLQDGIVPDLPVDLNGGSSGQLTPIGLEDVPDPGIRLVQLSDNRHQDPEDVGMVSPGGAGNVTIAVFGYNGAFSPKAYTLRVKETAPQPTPTCQKAPLAHQGEGTTPDSLPDVSSLPSNLNTIILVDEKRLGDTYGSTDEATAVSKLDHLAGDASLGVSGVVVPVEKIPGVQTLYGTWDDNPCDPSAANAVANAIADEVQTIAAARAGVQYVVFGGGDDQIPFFRLPDLSLIANESGFASQFAPNEYQGSLAAGDLLSDDPYLDTNPVPASGQQLFPPNLAGGRLVETAQDISNAVTAFENAPTPGALKSSTAFVSGYDFVADGSERVATNLSGHGVTVRRLGGNPISATANFSGLDLLGGAFPVGGPSDINSWNGHYDNTRTQTANGDILSTSGLGSGLNGGIFFTMGCHAGFQTTDAVVGSTVLDWPQYFAQHDTGFVGNTGYGLGDTDSVAFSEELIADLAGNLGGSSTLGQSLLQAKRQYYLSRVAFSNYDEKALSEAELYGLPMYGVGQAPRSLMAADPSPDPVNGSTSSTSPSQGSLSAFPGSGVQSASFAAAPRFVGPTTGQDGDYFTNDGQVQAPNYRPLQPFVSLPAARAGLVAHGVVIDNLTSQDHTTDALGQPWVPDNVRPTLNSSASEPPPSFTDEAWPEKIPTLVSLGTDQSLNLITGQFFTESSGSTTTGVERLWTQIGGRVTYSNSLDFTPPTIDSINAFQSNGVVAFSGQFSDLDQSGSSGTVAFAEVVYDDGNGNWTALPLQFDSTSGLWSGGAPFAGPHVQYFVEACDRAGNCGYSSNKGRYFDAEPLPAGTGGPLTILPSRPPDAAGTWYKSGLEVTATSTAPTASIGVDGGPFAPGPVALSGDGAHIVAARDSDGNTATAVYLIDSRGPVVTPAISPAAPDGTNSWYVHKPTVSFSCTDNVSGVARCSGPSTLDDNAAPQAVNGSGVDNAGNTGHGSLSGIKVDTTAPATPTFNGVSEGQIFPINSLPAGFTCSSSDPTSGLKNCVVSGYGNALGSHTLIATATDNAGNTSTKQISYTVGFQAGNILSPVAAPSNDQTNPSATDLQVFKIKSTLPLKFQFYLDSAKTTLMTTPPVGSTAILNVQKLNSSTSSTDQTDLVTGSADSGNLFRWTAATAYQYVYNMSTTKLTPGTYYCTITLKASGGTILGQSVPQYFVLRS